ncbi:MAG: PspA/IM30 family protein, partial [Candidatus Humimicrobiaceae bacterium]
ADTSVKQYQKMYDNISSQSETLREQVDLLKKKLNEARARQSMLIARDKVAEARQEVINAVGDLDSSGAFAKMDKMEKKIAEKEAQADAAFDISGMDDEEDDEFEEIESKQAADDELARLKKELSKE